jgi:hypothetical protein
MARERVPGGRMKRFSSRQLSKKSGYDYGEQQALSGQAGTVDQPKARKPRKIRRMGSRKPTEAEGYHAIGTKGIARTATNYPGRATGMAKAANRDPREFGLSGNARPEPFSYGTTTEQSYQQLGVRTPQELAEAQLERTRMIGMGERNPFIFEVDDQDTDANGIPRVRKKTGKQRAAEMEEQQVSEELGGGTSPFTFHKILQTPEFYADENIRDMWGDMSGSAQIRYKNQVRGYRENLAEALTNQDANFESLEQYEEFLQGVRGYSDGIGSAVREMGVQMLERLNPDLFKRLQGQQQAESANRDLFRRWADRNPREDGQPRQFRKDGSGPDMTEFRDDPNVMEHFWDHTTQSLQREEVRQFTPQEESVRGREQAQRDFVAMGSPADREVVSDGAGKWSIKKKDDTLSDAQIDANIRDLEAKQGDFTYSRSKHPVTGDTIVEKKKYERWGGGNDRFRDWTQKDRKAIADGISAMMKGKPDPLLPPEEKKTGEKSGLDKHKQRQNVKEALITAQQYDLDLGRGENGELMLQIGPDPNRGDSWYEIPNAHKDWESIRKNLLKSQKRTRDRKNKEREEAAAKESKERFGGREPANDDIHYEIAKEFQWIRKQWQAREAGREYVGASDPEYQKHANRWQGLVDRYDYNNEDLERVWKAMNPDEPFIQD